MQRIFTFTTRRDKACIIVSFLAAIGSGLSFPAMTIIVGNLIGSISATRVATVADFLDEFREIINSSV